MPQLHPPSAQKSDTEFCLTRRLLAQIYADFVNDRHRPEFAFDADFEICTDEDKTDDPDNANLQTADIDFVAPLSDQLEQHEIALQQSEGVDPYAIDYEGQSRLPERKTPFQQMMYAARFAALITSPDKEQALADPQTITLLRVPESDARERLNVDFPEIFDQTEIALNGRVNLSGTGIFLLRSTTSSNGNLAKSGFATEVEKAIKDGHNIVAVAADQTQLPDCSKAFCIDSYDFPPVTRTVIVEVLRQTHSMTGQLSDTLVRNSLPMDEDLGRLPLAVIQSAFQEATTIKVALRLRALSDRYCSHATPKSQTLSAMYLPPSISTAFEQVVNDIELWRRGDLEWSDMNSSIFISGQPGTGKTMAANSLAGTLNIPLVAASYGDCQKAGHQGDFLRVLSEKVEKAIASTPCVFFLDELDSFQNRANSTRNSGYLIAIINALLEHLTTLNETPGVIVIGASNFPRNIDPAILRPGRFDLHLALSVPTKLGVEELLRSELNEDVEGLNMALLINRMVGQTGAQIAAVVREARGQARRAKVLLTDAHITAALDRVAPLRGKSDLYRVAIHEAGHAVVAHALGYPLPEVVRITSAGGEYVTESPFAATKRLVDIQITTALAGRAAEKCIIGSVSIGAENDLQQATEFAFNARYRWALYEKNLLSLDNEKIAALDPLSPLGATLNADLKAYAGQAHDLVLTHRMKIEETAAALLKHREIYGRELSALLSSMEQTVDETHQKPAAE